jgi:hypothetical protein
MSRPSRQNPHVQDRKTKKMHEPSVFTHGIPGLRVFPRRLQSRKGR